MKLFWKREEIIDLIKKVAIESKTLESKFVQKNELKNNDKSGVSFPGLENRIAKLEQADTVKMFEDKIQSLERKLGQLISDFEAYKKQNPATSNETNKQVEALQTSVKYAAAIRKGGFPNDLSNNKGNRYFQFSDININEAHFEYCGTFDYAKANIDEIKDACEVISGSVADATKIVNIKKGDVILKDDKWEVTKKAEIKFV